MHSTCEVSTILHHFFTFARCGKGGAPHPARLVEPGPSWAPAMLPPVRLEDGAELEGVRDLSSWVDDLESARVRNRLQKRHGVHQQGFTLKQGALALLTLALFFTISYVFYGGGHGGGPNTARVAAAAAAVPRNASLTWTAVDTVYFAITTCTTVGYGDLHPTTRMGKAFTIGFIFFGIGMVGVALSRIVDFAISHIAAAEAAAARRVLAEAQRARERVRRVSVQMGQAARRVSGWTAQRIKVTRITPRKISRALRRTTLSSLSSPFARRRTVGPERTTPAGLLATHVSEAESTSVALAGGLGTEVDVKAAAVEGV